jgi:hypothetical protein
MSITFMFTYFVDFNIYEGVLKIPKDKDMSNIDVICQHKDIKLNIEHSLTKYIFKDLLHTKKINLYKDLFESNIYFYSNEYFWKSKKTSEIKDKNYIIKNSHKIEDWEILTVNINSDIIIETANLFPWDFLYILKKPNMNHFLLLNSIKNEELKKNFITLVREKLNEY